MAAPRPSSAWCKSTARRPGQPALLDGRRLRPKDRFWEMRVREQGRCVEMLLSWLRFPSPQDARLLLCQAASSGPGCQSPGEAHRERGQRQGQGGTKHVRHPGCRTEGGSRSEVVQLRCRRRRKPGSECFLKLCTPGTVYVSPESWLGSQRLVASLLLPTVSWIALNT